MILFHIDSGLGNQMLAYCEYLALKKSNPGEDIYTETLVYEIPECDKTISQWNGFELERVFGLKIPNLKDLLSEKDYQYVKDCLVKSEFWRKNWNYSPYVTKALSDIGHNLENMCQINNEYPQKSAIKSFFGKSRQVQLLKYYYLRHKQIIDTKAYVNQYNHKTYLFGKYHDAYLGQKFSFIFRDNGIEQIKDDILKSFVFPEIKDERNRQLASMLRSTNSVAIHARRGDMLGRTWVYYQGGYFKRAVSYIKKHVDSPVFYFFCDPGSSEWCMKNLNIFGLTKNVDNINFVTWNKGNDSFRDMQLMSYCKHNIITNSSFGWWGAYLNTNPDKITCTPDWAYNSTNHF